VALQRINVTFYWHYADPYRINPQVDGVVEGSTQHIKCKFTELISWLFNDKPELPNNVVSENNELIIKHVKKFNQGSYICKGYTDKFEVFLAEAIIVVISNSYSLVLQYYSNFTHQK